MSKKKAAGKTRQHTRPVGKRLGVKVSDGQPVKPGMVLVRQRGAGFHSGTGTSLGRDFTLFSVTTGIVRFGQKLGKRVVLVLGK